MILSGPREGSILSWSKSTDLEHLESLKALKRCPQCLTWTGRPVDRSIWVPPFSKMQGFAPQQMHESLLVSMWIFLASWSDVSNTGIKCPTIQRSKNHHFHHIILGLFHGSISHKKKSFYWGKFPCHHGGTKTTNLSGNPTPYHQASGHSQITWITISTQKLVGGFNPKNVCASRQIGSRNPKTWNNKY